MPGCHMQQHPRSLSSLIELNFQKHVNHLIPLFSSVLPTAWTNDPLFSFLALRVLVLLVLGPRIRHRQRRAGLKCFKDKNWGGHCREEVAGCLAVDGGHRVYRWDVVAGKLILEHKRAAKIHVSGKRLRVEALAVVTCYMMEVLYIMYLIYCYVSIQVKTSEFS